MLCRFVSDVSLILFFYFHFSGRLCYLGTLQLMQRHQMPQEPNGTKDVSLTIAIHICNRLRRLEQIMQMVHSCVISTNVHVPLTRAQQLVRHVLIRRVRLHVRVMLDITAMVPLLVLVVQHVEMVVLGKVF